MKKFEVNHFTNLRLLWCAIALLVFGFIAVAVPNRYAQLTTISPNANTLVGQLQPAEAYALEQAGIPVPIFAAYMTTLGTFIAIVFALIGLAVAWLQPQDRMALLASIVLIGAATVVAAAGMFQPQWRLIVIAVRAIFGASVVPFFFLFPDGRFVPRWTRWLTGIWLIYTVTWLIFPSLSPPFSYGRGFTGSELPRNAWFLLWFCIGLAVQIYRYLKFSNAIQRQQIKVVVFGFGIGLVALVTGISILTITRLAPLSSLAIFARLFGASILLLGTLAGPLSIGISILRYHLFDIDLIINRTLIYGALTASVVGLYVLIVGGSGLLLQTQSNLLGILITSLLVSVLFQPLRRRLQSVADRFVPVAQIVTDEPIINPLPQGENEQIITQSERLTQKTLGRSGLIMLRMIWGMIALFVLSFVAIGVPNRYIQLTTISPDANTLVGQLRPEEAHAFEQNGLPIPVFAAYITGLDTFIGIVFALMGLTVAWLRPKDRAALLVSIVLISSAMVIATTGTFQPQWHPVITIVHAILGASIVPVFYLFPDGQFVPRWTRWLTAIWLIYTVTWLIFPSLSLPFGFARGLTGSELPRILWFLLWAFLGLASQIYRYVKVSSPIQRQQIKWVVFGYGLGLIGLMTGIGLITLSRLTPLSAPIIAVRLVGITIVLLGLLLIPLSIGISILRYHLFDVDIIINRTLVYGALTGIIVGTFVVLVGFLSTLFQSSGNSIIAILATGLVALFFNPLRQRLQSGVNRLMYGERDDPYAALSRLGRRLESTVAPEAVLPAVVNTVREVLKLPYVAIYLGQDHAGHKIVAESASPSLRSENGRIIVPGMEREGLCMPLIHQGETLGYIVLGPRAPNEAFNSTDLRLLEDLAPQVGVAVHAVRLTADLQRSRERLVLAREEERRRLRRDLHDGIGPTMAGLTLKLDAARDLVSSGLETGEKENLEEALQLLGELKAQTQETVQNIRHIVHTLRPPSLDVLGLVPALQAHFGQVATRRSPNIQMTNTPQNFPRLSAAVEVAAYHIILEAVTNVIHHAQAGNCEVSLVLENDNLKMGIKDDGVGLPKVRSHGIGLNSMRERAEELGGRLELSSSRQGTRVCAEIPISPARSE